jgi:hypothetical protein
MTVPCFISMKACANAMCVPARLKKSLLPTVDYVSIRLHSSQAEDVPKCTKLREEPKTPCTHLVL